MFTIRREGRPRDGRRPARPRRRYDPVETPAAAHRQRDDLTFELTDSFDNLAKAGFKL